MLTPTQATKFNPIEFVGSRTGYAKLRIVKRGAPGKTNPYTISQPETTILFSTDRATGLRLGFDGATDGRQRTEAGAIDRTLYRLIVSPEEWFAAAEPLTTGLYCFVEQAPKFKLKGVLHRIQPAQTDRVILAIDTAVNVPFDLEI